MLNVGYYNGVIAPLEELMIPANDRSNYYGDGVYEAVYGRNYKMFAVNEHITRFYRSCRMLKIEPNITPEDLLTLFEKLIHLCDSHEFVLYWQMTRGTALRGHAFPKGVEPNLLISVRPHTLLDNSSKRFKLLSQEDNRYYFCNIKTINLLPNVRRSYTCGRTRKDNRHSPLQLQSCGTGLRTYRSYLYRCSPRYGHREYRGC